MKSQAVAVVSVLLLLAILIAESDCQIDIFEKGRKREMEVQVTASYKAE